MRVNKLKLVQIFVEELMVVYGDLKSAQDDNSEGGSQITRREIWALIIDFICNLAPRLEAALLAKNGLDRVSDLRWRLIKALAEELKEIPAELGALVLAVVLLWIVLGHYQTLIDQSLSEHREDRALYRESMQDLSGKVDRIGRDVEDIKLRLQ
jgi:hypothetical protein